MAANRLRLTSLKLVHNYNVPVVYKVKNSSYSTGNVENEELGEKKSSYAEFDKKQELLKKPEPPAEPDESFVSLLKNSRFIAMGDPIGKVVSGYIYHVVGKDLYIDFGWKFPTVCTAPEKYQSYYVPGAEVKLLIKDLELSTKFLGAEEEITLCEADCILLGLAKQPKESKVETDT